MASVLFRSVHQTLSIGWNCTALTTLTRGVSCFSLYEILIEYC